MSIPGPVVLFCCCPTLFVVREVPPDTATQDGEFSLAESLVEPVRPGRPITIFSATDSSNPQSRTRFNKPSRFLKTVPDTFAAFGCLCSKYPRSVAGLWVVVIVRSIDHFFHVAKSEPIVVRSVLIRRVTIHFSVMQPVLRQQFTPIRTQFLPQRFTSRYLRPCDRSI